MDAGVAFADHRSHFALVPALRGESGHQMGTGPTLRLPQLTITHRAGLHSLLGPHYDEFGL
jgi:hypothetical protein